ncbi:sigma-70 family RNA polymerase sigma factor [bacterium]|nr:sigma-70 family RNA polymerase sigma factor [bacterium]
MAIPLPCPDGELLATILRGRVASAAGTATIARHLAECAQCRAVADLLSDFDEPLVPDPCDGGFSINESNGPMSEPAGEQCVPVEPTCSEPLIKAIRGGDAQAWSQLVAEYHGRLLAFARTQLRQESDAEDAVQETFVSLLKSLSGFRGEASLETWLFQILRRRIADQYRRLGSRREVTLVTGGGSGADIEASELDQPAAQSPSWYVRRAEQDAADLQTLAAAVAAVTGQLKTQQKFRDLVVFDLLFFAGRRNCEIAALVKLEETAVAVLKHRFLRRVASRVEAAESDDAVPDRSGSPSDELLTRVWESTRPTCPKRSTLGKFVLGALTDEWDRYVAFHTSELGCRFCSANLDDLTNELNSAEASTESARHRILESTVGFLPGRDS